MQAAKKRKRTAMIVAIVVAVVWCTLLVGVAVQAAMPHPAAGQPAQVTADTSQLPGTKQMLGWLAMMFGIGEVAGLVGMGISNIRRNKRQEREAQRISFTPDNARLLRYEDHLSMLKAGAA